MEINVNIEFLESYKRLERLCGEIYGGNGVMAYLDQMREVPEWERQWIPGWREDWRNLHRLKRIRNELTHDSGSLYRNMADWSDVRWLENFRERILHTEDPLSLLQKRRNPPKPVTPKPAVPKPAPQTEQHWRTGSVTRPSAEIEKEDRLGCLLRILIGVLIVVLVCVSCNS